jgi:hypothetical protein
MRSGARAAAERADARHQEDHRAVSALRQGLALFTQYRLTAMRVVAVLAGLFFVVGTAPQAISPWGPVTLSNTQGVHDMNIHRWSAALAGGPDIGAALVLFYLAWRPLKAPLALQWLAVVVVVFLAANVPFAGSAVALIAIPIVLVLALYPDPRSLLRPPWSDGYSRPLLGIGGLVGILLVFDAARSMAAQIQGADELAANYDWAANSEHLINVGLAAVFAAMNRDGSGILRIMVGVVLMFLGAAAVTAPGNPGSWGLIGGALAIALALAILALSVYELRQGEEIPGA